MKLQNFTVIFIIIILPIILLLSLYISTGLKTIKYQALYDTGLITATQDAIQAFEINTTNNQYSTNAEVKRSVIKSSIKMLEKGLCNTCNISSYNTDEIEEYIPAILFGMNNGFYLYSPSYNPTTDKYEHSLKNYVYYSETLNGKTSNTNGVVIIYHLDSYIEVSGYFDSNYDFGEGYLININQTKFYDDSGRSIDSDEFYTQYKNGLKTATSSLGRITYYGTEIDIADELAVNYFVDNYKFSKWFDETVYSNVNECNWLSISENNDPEDPESAFSKHKKEVIRNKIQNVLNSSITAYSKRIYGQNYKMPKLSEEDWEKIYTDISVITFFQGKKIGFTKYNGYCVLNSNNHNELINPSLLYFSTDDNNDNIIDTENDYYHDIRCSEILNLSAIQIKQEGKPNITTIRGWKIGRFQRKTITETDLEGNETHYHTYERDECGCYECINGSVSSSTSVYDYIAVANASDHTGNTENNLIKKSYWTSLARERAKLHEDKEMVSDITVEKKVKLASESDDKYRANVTARNGETVFYKIIITNNASKTDTINIFDKFDCSKITNIEQKSFKIAGIDATKIYEKLKDDDANEKGIEWDITIDARKKVEIIYSAKVFGGSEELIKNTVNIHSTSGESFGPSEATVTIRATDITVKKLIDGENEKNIKYGDTVTYTVIIKNNAETEIVDIIDEIPSGIEIIGNIPTINEVNGKSSDNKIKWENVSLNGGEEKTITYKAKIKGNIGETLINNVKVYVPSDESTLISQASANSTIKATIKTKKGSGKDFHVIMVLDNSGSMTGKIESVKSAATKLIETVGEDKVTIISFAQNPKVLGNIDDYNIWGNGLSTNYTGGLHKAIDCMNAPELDYYVVFMSDGCPTATQNTAIINAESNPDKPDESALNTLFLKLITFGWDSVQSVLGGWLECIWKSEEQYGFRLLLTGSTDWEFDIGVSKNAWNMIREQVNGIKANAQKLYTVYFDTSTSGNDKTPEFGLKHIASEEGDFYTSNNENGLITNFENIANSITNQEKENEYNLGSSLIKLEKIDDIQEIQIGDNKYNGTKVDVIKSQITKDSDGNGILNVNNIVVEGKYIFKTNEDITIIYK